MKIESTSSGQPIQAASVVETLESRVLAATEEAVGEQGNGMAFSLSLFVQAWTREVFQSMDDEAWEKSEW
jgi:hypothetical protein